MNKITLNVRWKLPCLEGLSRSRKGCGDLAPAREYGSERIVEIAGRAKTPGQSNCLATSSRLRGSDGKFLPNYTTCLRQAFREITAAMAIYGSQNYWSREWRVVNFGHMGPAEQKPHTQIVVVSR